MADAPPLRARLQFPLYLLVSRKGPRTLPAAEPLANLVWHAGRTRRSILGYQTRQSAAVWIERERGRRYRPFAVRTVNGLDQLAVVAVTRHARRWLALEPALDGLSTGQCVDLVGWLQERQPWSATLGQFCYRHQLATALLDGMLQPPD